MFGQRYVCNWMPLYSCRTWVSPGASSLQECWEYAISKGSKLRPKTRRRFAPKFELDQLPVRFMRQTQSSRQFKNVQFTYRLLLWISVHRSSKTGNTVGTGFLALRQRCCGL